MDRTVDGLYGQDMTWTGQWMGYTDGTCHGPNSGWAIYIEMNSEMNYTDGTGHRS